MTNWEQCTAVERDPDKVSGAWVFRETRVPVSALFENLKDGATVEQFLEWFPGGAEGGLPVTERCRWPYPTARAVDDMQWLADQSGG